MKSTFIRTSSVLLAVCFLLSAAPLMGSLSIVLSRSSIASFFNGYAQAAIIVDSGTCGEEEDSDLTWTLDDEGTLVISGTGPIKRQAFSNRSDIISAVIKDGVTDIDVAAFECCSSLVNVTIPNSVINIGDSAFSWCDSLTSVTIPDGVTNIGWVAFSGCSRLKDVIIPDSVTSIGGYAFDNCPLLHILCNKESYAQAFAEKNGYVYILLDGSEEENTISGTSGSLKWSIDRRSGVMTITGNGDMPAFSDSDTNTLISDRYAPYVHTVVIEAGVTSIGNFAFYNRCHHLTSVMIPDTVTSIGEYAFGYCTELTSVTIPDSVTNIEAGAFHGCKGLTSVTIGSNVMSIGDFAFSDCTGLTSVTIPDSVTIIIGAFDGCDSLNAIYFYNPECYIAGRAIPDCATVYGYATSTAEAYADAFGLPFQEIVHEHIKPDYTLGDVNGDGVIKSDDARLALRASVKLEPTIVEGSDAYNSADVNGDGVIKSDDARIILRLSVKLETMESVLSNYGK